MHVCLHGKRFFPRVHGDFMHLCIIEIQIIYYHNVRHELKYMHLEVVGIIECIGGNIAYIAPSSIALLQ